MNPNVRLAIIVVVFVVLGVGIWTVLGGTDGGEKTVATSPDQATPQSIESTEPAFSASDSRSIAPMAEPDTSEAEDLSSAQTTQARATNLPTGIYTISGRVVMPDASPAQGVAVVLHKIDYRDMDFESEKHLEIQATSDAEGKFSFSNLESGGVFISSRFEGYGAFTNAHVSDWQPHSDVRLELKLTYGIRGRVVNSEGDPVAGAIVAPMPSDREQKRYQGTEFFVAKTRSDEDGAFSIFGIEEGRWDVVAFAKNHATSEVLGVSTGVEDLEIVMLRGGGLGGVVLTEDTREPLAGVAVVAGYVDLPWDRNTATSDADGRFHIGSLRSGEYGIAIEDDLRVLTHKVDPVEVIAEEDWDGLELRVADGGVIEGRLIDDESGRGIRGVTIGAHGSNRNALEVMSAMPRESEPTDAQGNFRLSGLSESHYSLMPTEVQGYSRRNQRSQVIVASRVGETVSGVKISLKKGLSVRGIVVDASGQPVAGATVSGRSDNNGGRGNGRSGPNGQFELSGFDLSEAYFWAERDNIVSEMYGPVAMHDYAGEEIELELKDERNCSISGDVVDDSGRPLADVNLWINSTTRRFMSMPSDRTGDDGLYEITNLPPGDYSVRCSNPGGYNQGAEYGQIISLKSGEHREGIRLVIDEKDGLTITGRVVDNKGEPMHQANVNAWHTRNGGTNAYVATDEDGYFELKGLSEGPHQVSVNRWGYSQFTINDVEAGTQGLDIELATATTLTGFIKDGETGEPLDEFQIYAVSHRTSSMQGWFYQSMQRFYDPEGFFQTQTESSDNGTIIVMSHGYATAFHPFDIVAPGEPIENIEIALEPGTAVNGVVIDDAGNPVSRASVFIGAVPDRWQRSQSNAATSDESGAFTVEGLPRTERQLSAWHPAYAAGTARVPYSRSGSAEVEIVLPRAGTIQGRITIGGRSPEGRAYLNYRHDGIDGAEYNEAKPDGTFEIVGLPPGTVTVDAYLRNVEEPNRSGRNLERVAIVAAEEVTIVDFDFADLNASMEGRVMIGEAPAESGSVRATVETSTGEESYRGAIQDDGSYRIEEMASGSAQINVSGANADSSGATQTTLTVSANSTLTQDFNLQEYIRITGIVSGGPGINRGVSVYPGHISIQTPFSPLVLQQLDRNRVDRFTSNGTTGDFEYNVDLPGPGEYTLAAYAVDGTDVESLAAIRFATTFVTVEEGDRLEMDLQIP